MKLLKVLTGKSGTNSEVAARLRGQGVGKNEEI